MNDPSMFSRFDADRILRRAAEIEGSDPGRHLSVAELRSIAGEVGLAHDAVERAIAEAREAGDAASRRPPVQKWGLIVTHLSVIRQVPTQITSEQLMRVVRLLQPYREGAPHVRLDEQEVTWRDRKGLRFAVTSVGGTTEIRVYVSKILVRRGRWMGWVKAAADRIESLVTLVATRDAERGGVERAPLSRPDAPPAASASERERSG